MQEALFPQITTNALTVSELNRQIKSLLESQYPSLWIIGEISNFRAHSSGHFYFTLKDEASQLSAVMFRGANRYLKFMPEDGLKVLANGRISLYEARGNYQLIVGLLAPQGRGALQFAFDQLRERLGREGLFDETRKRSLPALPKTIGLITSPTGAVLKDMVRILHRRHPGVNILLYSVSVQGESAPAEIANAIEIMNAHSEADLLIIGRGGGSIEDLWAFNTEQVARALYASKIPVISAVGHETDFTIADFVADLRAPTPSAAAELAVPVLENLCANLERFREYLIKNIQSQLEIKRDALRFLISHLKHPKRRLEELAQRLDDLFLRMQGAVKRTSEVRRLHFSNLVQQLDILSPLATLSRGYSIVRQSAPDGTEGALIKEDVQVKKGDDLAITLSKGKIKAVVS